MSNTKFFIDTEFIEAGPSQPLVLLSIGIVCEDGREYYAANTDANLSKCNGWVRENVLPHLGTHKLTLATIRQDVIDFVGDGKPEFWGYYADYDWVVFAQIFGTMMDLPKGWPMYCRDIKQLCDERGNPQLPGQSSTEHNALNDARWNKLVYEFLVSGSPAIPATPQSADRTVSVLVECGGRTYRVIDNVRALVGRVEERTLSESVIGRKVLDLARKVEVGQ